jgi:hypothetical protein
MHVTQTWLHLLAPRSHFLTCPYTLHTLSYRTLKHTHTHTHTHTHSLTHSLTHTHTHTHTLLACIRLDAPACTWITARQTWLTPLYPLCQHANSSNHLLNLQTGCICLHLHMARSRTQLASACTRIHLADTSVHLAHTQHPPADAARGGREDESAEDNDGDSGAVYAGYQRLGSGDDASEADSDDEDDGAMGAGREDSAPSAAAGRAPASVSTVYTAGDPPDARGLSQARGHGMVPAAFCSSAQVEASCVGQVEPSSFSAQEAAHIRMAMSGFDLPAPEWARELDVSTHVCPAARPMTCCPAASPMHTHVT